MGVPSRLDNPLHLHPYFRIPVSSGNWAQMERWTGNIHCAMDFKLSVVAHIFLEEDDKDSIGGYNCALGVYFAYYRVFPRGESPFILLPVSVHRMDLRGVVPEFLHRDAQQNRRGES